MGGPWSLLAIKGLQARSHPPPRYLNAHLHPTMLMEDLRRGGEEPAVSRNSCPTNHRTYRYKLVSEARIIWISEYWIILFL